MRIVHRRAADLPWMKPYADRCPGESRIHRTAARAAWKWTPAFAGEALNIVAVMNRLVGSGATKAVSRPHIPINGIECRG